MSTAVVLYQPPQPPSAIDHEQPNNNRQLRDNFGLVPDNRKLGSGTSPVSGTGPGFGPFSVPNFWCNIDSEALKKVGKREQVYMNKIDDGPYMKYVTTTMVSVHVPLYIVYYTYFMLFNLLLNVYYSYILYILNLCAYCICILVEPVV